MIAAVLAVLVLLLGGAWYLLNSNRSPQRAVTAPPPTSPAPAATSSPAPAGPIRETAATAPSTVPPPAPTPEPGPIAPLPAPAPRAPVAAAPSPPPATTRTSSVNVISAELCRSLTTSGAWNCTPASGTLAPGPLVFFTRVASTRDTTIEHRWYRDDRLHQRVPLRIRANASGFRTYSRTAITPDRTGKWKVELRSQDGELLDEKTFAVQ
jgi:hypothetical protein